MTCYIEPFFVVVVVVIFVRATKMFIYVLPTSISAPFSIIFYPSIRSLILISVSTTKINKPNRGKWWHNLFCAIFKIQTKLLESLCDLSQNENKSLKNWCPEENNIRKLWTFWTANKCCMKPHMHSAHTHTNSHHLINHQRISFFLDRICLKFKFKWQLKQW